MASHASPAPARSAQVGPVSGAPAVAAVVSAPPSTPVSVNPTSVTGAHVEILARVIVRPLNAGDGTYRVEMALHPAELGALQAVVSLRGAELQVQLSPQTREAHDVLARDADALKTVLSRDGLAVSVTVRDPSQHASSERRDFGERGPRPRSVAATEIMVIAHDASTTGSQIHLLL